MLDELHIEGLGVIEDVTLDLAEGLTVVTGETGAGKTMLVTALQLLLGVRADTSLVRSGVPRAVVEARVHPPPPTAYEQEWVGEDEQELVVVREVANPESDGRSRARIGGRLATVSALGEVLGQWVEVHAQGSHVRLQQASVQRRLLDRFAGEEHEQRLDEYARTYDAWVELRRRRSELETSAREREREKERLSFEIEEIDRAELDPERDAVLGEELDRLEHAEQLAAAAAQAATALGEQGASEPVGLAVAALRGASGHDQELDDLLARVEGLAVELADVRRTLRDYAESVNADQSRLEELRRRDRLVRDLQRKYGEDVDAVLAYADEARERVDQLESDLRGADDLERRGEQLEQRLRSLADGLHARRDATAQDLAKAVLGHLADLAMPHARFDVVVEDAGDLRSHGRDRVEFVLAANPGEPPRPFGQAASGGELSRVALAIEVALADIDDAKVLVFDEVDAGVGGATALAVGEKLARLSVGRQVLCVTHLAQLAAFADVHHVVEKSVRGGRTVTSARAVEPSERAAELARMLSGTAERAAGLEHARELLAEAAGRVPGG